ncbi:predicted protein [Naegleria gruberi]|uniref:Predicted protein n=1 Tax=Naegleria gruberi TaxID=5762 RepID=D2W0V0_NAEGR|nr:uncharacterized protein NAEGRDRAFT_74989 [Naegleria gruberi]EFC37353.1 predicted protein [Naegleria gruberi]|eukprot:XP_002670097.1 predicted protein [Naegleria gruberi strain NEG-M]
MNTQVLSKYIESKDEDEQLLILYQVFKNYDLDGNNAIDKRELIPFFMDFLKVLGMDPSSITPDDVKKFMSGIDSDGNGTISFVEFTNWFKDAVLGLIPPSKKKKKKRTLLDSYLAEKNTTKQVEVLQSIFRKYDTNVDGKIDRDEFDQFLTDLFKQFELGIPSGDHVTYFFDVIDTDKSGGITINEIDVWLRENIEKFTH